MTKFICKHKWYLTRINTDYTKCTVIACPAGFATAKDANALIWRPIPGLDGLMEHVPGFEGCQAVKGREIVEHLDKYEIGENDHARH